MIDFVDNTSKYAVGGAIRGDDYNAINIRASSFEGKCIRCIINTPYTTFLLFIKYKSFE